MNKETRIHIFCGYDSVDSAQALEEFKSGKSGFCVETFSEEAYQKNPDEFQQRIREALLTPEMFSKGKLVHLKAAFLTESQLCRFLESLPADLQSDLAVSYGEIENSCRKKLGNIAELHEFKKTYERDFLTWVRAEFLKYQVKIDFGVPELVFSATGGKKEQAVSEIGKLVLYSLGKPAISIEDAKAVLCFQAGAEWLVNDLVRSFFNRDKKQTDSLIRQCADERNEIVVFEVLRDGIRALGWITLCDKPGLPEAFIKISRDYQNAVSQKRFWDINKIFAEAKKLLLENFPDLPSNCPLKSERQLCFYGTGLSFINKSNLVQFYDLLTDYEITSKNRDGFTVEGLELLFIKLWAIKN
ncbi:MAG: hypothetical protein PHW04_11760 [Candidatus Wallbacteria bacterium]|nr:hypothetical protein [Candidatus Wallbacteria bacterium]